MSTPDLSETFVRETEAAIGRSAKCIEGWLSSDDPRVPLLALVRTYDYHTWLTHQGQTVSPRILKNFHWGLNEALLVANVAKQSGSGLPDHEVDDEAFHPLTNALQAAGQVRLGRHLLSAHAQGLIAVESLKDGNCILRPAVPDTLAEVAEYIDLVEANVMAMRVSGMENEIQEMEAALPEMRRKMVRQVELAEGGFLIYEPDDEVVQFFRKLARLKMHGCTWTWEEFPREAKFGGIEFGRHCDWAGVMAGAMLMHGNYVSAVAGRYREFTPINAITLPVGLDHAVEMAKSVTKLDAADARSVVQASAMGSWNWDTCLRMQRAPAAPQYQIGDDMLLWSYAGCTFNPLDFTLRAIERSHPGDWSENGKKREETFRRQLGELLATHNDVVILPKPIWIDSALGKTDVDLVVADLANGVLGAFQLKWQRMLSADMRARRTQGGNLMEDANKWVRRVHAWHAEGRMKAALASTSLGKQGAERIKECRVFVVGRHFSRVSGGAVADGGAAWGNWWQIKRISMAGKIEASDPLRALHSALEAETPAARIEGIEIAATEAQLHGLTLSLRLS